MLLSFNALVASKIRENYYRPGIINDLQSLLDIEWRALFNYSTHFKRNGPLLLRKLEDANLEIRKLNVYFTWSEQSGSWRVFWKLVVWVTMKVFAIGSRLGAFYHLTEIDLEQLEIAMQFRLRVMLNSSHCIFIGVFTEPLQCKQLIQTLGIVELT